MLLRAQHQPASGRPDPEHAASCAPAALAQPLASGQPHRPEPPQTAELPACPPACLCSYELQLRYGSIGWSVGATLGYALGAADTKRVLALIGDGSFQMTAQVGGRRVGGAVGRLVSLAGLGYIDGADMCYVYVRGSGRWLALASG